MRAPFLLLSIGFARVLGPGDTEAVSPCRRGKLIPDLALMASVTQGGKLETGICPTRPLFACGFPPRSLSSLEVSDNIS